MKALKATVTILLDPRVIGPDAQTEWSGPLAFASALEYTDDDGEVEIDESNGAIARMEAFVNDQ